MIKVIVRVLGGDVFVFDEHGEQMPEYQGQYPLVQPAIIRDAPEDAIYLHWCDRGAAQTVIRESW